MTRFVIIVLGLLFSFSVAAQDVEAPTTSTEAPKKFIKLAQKFSLTATAGTGNYNGQFSQLGRVSLGELGIQFKATPRISFGISTMGSILCSESYYDNEGNLITDDDGEDEMDDDDDPNEPEDMDIESEEDDCEDDFGSNIVGNFTYKLSEKVPFFIRGNGGYSFNSQSVVYSVSFGYHQKLFAGFGLLAGLRYSDMIRMNSTKNFAGPTGGLKAELGISWNF